MYKNIEDIIKSGIENYLESKKMMISIIMY